MATYKVDNRYFYQGLEYLNETTLLSSEGWWGSSNLALLAVDDTLRQVNRVWKQEINPSYFGEGATEFRGKVYQLTWQSNVVVVYTVQD